MTKNSTLLVQKAVLSNPAKFSLTGGTPICQRRLIYSFALVLALFQVIVVGEDVLEKAGKALELRRQKLVNYSVEVHTRTLMDMPQGRHDIDVRETHYIGQPGQFRRESISQKRDGTPVNPAEGGGRPGDRPGERRAGGMFGLPQLGQGRDILTQDGFLNQAEVKGKVRLGQREAVEILAKPKLPRIQVDKARLWVDPSSGMPLQLELQFGIGAFISGAKLVLELAWEKNEQITVPLRQSVSLTTGGFDERFGGGSTEVSTTWSAYQWDLEFAADFFKATGSATLAGQSHPRTAQRETSPDVDPFEEIRISPPGQAAEASKNTGGTANEVLIEGASRQVTQAGSSGNESEIIGRIMSFGGPPGGGMEGGPGGSMEGGSGGGPGGAMGGGPGGGMGGGFGGGMRGARIGGSRANRVQGSVSAGFSSSVLDAKPYSLNGAETADPHYFNWNAGVAVGGPLWKTKPDSTGPGGFTLHPSFFLEYNARRGQEMQSQYAAVPTLLERQGNFSQSVYQSGPLAGQGVRIYDPVTGVAYTNATIPTSLLNPTAQQLLSYIPLPNRNDPYLNYFVQENLTRSTDRVNLRFFLPVNENWRLNAAYNFDRTGADTFNIFPDLAGRQSGRGQNINISANQTLRAGLIQNIAIRWNRNRQQNLNLFAERQDIASQLGIQNTSPSPIDFGLPSLQFTNYTELNDGNSSFNVNEQNTLSDTIMWSRGRHFFRLGGDVTWRRLNELGNSNGSGVETFAGVATSTYDAGEIVPGTGYDLADFLLGLAQSSRIQYGSSDHYLRRREISVYINDNWRLHSRLTLQWGLRYQFVSPWVERYDRMANLDINSDFTQVKAVTPESTGSFFGEYPRALIESDHNNIAPRVAVAYRLRSGKYASVLRSSYGIFYPENSYTTLANQLIAQPPFGFTVQTTTTGLDYLNIQTAFSSQLAADIPNSYAVDPHFHLPLVQNWEFSWQQSLPGRIFVSVGYAGSRGAGLEILMAPNRVENGQSQIDQAAQFLYLTSGATSVFHGLQVLMTRRMSSSFSISAQYQYGKSMDDASSIAGGSRIVVQDNNNLAAEWGRSSFDRRHQLSLRSLLELPFGDRHRWLKEKGWANRLLSHWSMQGSLTANSGLPFTVRLLGNQINNSGTASQASERASTTGESADLPASQRTAQQWFNTAAFRLPDPGTFGDAGRGTINGPAAWNINLNLMRVIPLKAEGQRIMITIQTTNLLNHANYTGLNTIVNSRGFGEVTAVGPMRRMSVNFRFMF